MPATVAGGRSCRVARAHCTNMIDTHTPRRDAAACSTGPRGRRGGAARRRRVQADGADGRRRAGPGPDRARAVSRQGRAWESGGQRPAGASRFGTTRRLAGDLGETEPDEGLRMKGAWWMPWRWRPRKDAATRRNARGRRWQPAIPGSPNGATRPAHGRAPRSDPGRAPGELKHLSTPRNREDSLSSGERTGRSPNPTGGTACRRCPWGVGRVGWRGRQLLRSCDRTLEPKTAGTGHRRG